MSIDPLKLSVVIPAFNEAKRIQSCLKSVFAALQANARPGLTAEVIVTDNNSTDGTGDLARTLGAQVVFEPINQIARSRNAGAAAATGDWLLFFDADSFLPAPTLAEVLRVIDRKQCVGGGTVLAFDQAPVWARIFLAIGNFAMRFFRITPGCLIFCRADVFREIGGFSEELFAAEDADFGWRLRRWSKSNGSRMVILSRYPPITSSRKFHLYSRKEMFGLLLRFILRPRTTIRNRNGLQLFYDGRR